MFTPFKDDYAYGWVVPQPSPATFGRRQISHAGGINGFSSMLIRLPDDKMTIVVLANNESSNASRIARDLLAISLGEPYQIPAQRVAIAIDPAILDVYVGRYQLRPDFILTVTREGDRLMTQATGQQKVEMFPESETSSSRRSSTARSPSSGKATRSRTSSSTRTGGSSAPRASSSRSDRHPSRKRWSPDNRFQNSRLRSYVTNAARTPALADTDIRA